MALSARTVETAASGKHNDGHGLMLVVKPSGARSWVLRLLMAAGLARHRARVVA